MPGRSRIAIVAFSLLILSCASRERQASAQSTPSASQNEQPALVQAELGASFTLEYGRTASMRGTPLQLTFEELLEDSRCPSGVQCIHAGWATVRVKVVSGAESTSVELSTHRTSVATAFGYEIQLEDVAPYPVHNQEIERGSYRVKLLVRSP